MENNKMKMQLYYDKKMLPKTTINISLIFEEVIYI